MKRIIAVLIGLAALLSFSTPANANINNYNWARGTIFVQNMTPASAPGTVAYNWAVYYLRTLHDQDGVNWDVEWADCRVGSPCVHMWAGQWGATGWTGLTNYAATCGNGATTYCSWNGSGERADHTSLYWTTVKTNLYYGTTNLQMENTGCHEIGHAIPGLQHAGGATCMQATDSDYTEYQSSEVTEIRNKFVNITRKAYTPSYKVSAPPAAPHVSYVHEGPRTVNKPAPRPTMKPAGLTTRTVIVAYDLTTCRCSYNFYHTHAYENWVPVVDNITSYYETKIGGTGGNIRLYQSPADMNYNIASNSEDIPVNAHKDIYVASGTAVHALCWTDGNDGIQKDKVAMMVAFNNYGLRMTIGVIDDLSIPDGIRYAEHHC